MIKNIIIFIILIFFVLFPENKFSEVFQKKEETVKIIKRFIKYVKNNDINKLSKIIIYPLKRENPIPPVKSSKEFKLRYKEIFDTNLVKSIINSKITKDWETFGWRGIMFNEGQIILGYSGKVLYINYQSSYEKKLKKKLIESIKKKLYSKLKNFERPILIWKTKHYLIRIDRLKNMNFRYAAWYVNKSQSEKPNIILSNGKWVADGTGGNGYYEFKNKSYIYRCYEIYIGTKNSPPGYIQVIKNNKILLSENVLHVISN